MPADDDLAVATHYAGELLPVAEFTKRCNQHPYHLVYSLRFHPNGFLEWVTRDGQGMHFDDQGKILGFWYKSKGGVWEVQVGEDGRVRSNWRTGD